MYLQKLPLLHFSSRQHVVVNNNKVIATRKKYCNRFTSVMIYDGRLLGQRQNCTVEYVMKLLQVQVGGGQCSCCQSNAQIW